MRTQLYHLYRECFPKDDEDYASYYIRTKFNGENCYKIKKEGRILSMLFALDFNLNVGGAYFSCPFITGVATAKDARNLGLGRKNLKNAMLSERAKGKAVMTLYPENHAFYEKLGFVTYAFTDKIELSKIEDKSVPLSLEDAPAMAGLYMDFCEKNSYVYTVRNVEFFQNRIEEFLTQGECVGYFEDGELKSYAIYFDKKDVDEVVYENEEYVKFLGINSYRRPSLNGRPEGMIVVLDILTFLKAISYHKEFNLNLKIKLIDEVIEENNMVISFNCCGGKAEVEKLNDESEFDIEYLVPDFVSTILRTSENISLEKF